VLTFGRQEVTDSHWSVAGCDCACVIDRPTLDLALVGFDLMAIGWTVIRSCCLTLSLQEISVDQPALPVTTGLTSTVICLSMS